MQPNINVHALTEPVIVGLDVGNGRTKLVSNVGRPITFQSLAAPAESLGKSLTGEASGNPIMISGKAWEAGFAPGATGHPMEIFKGASMGDAHLALAKEALYRFGRDIDVLVVGLTSDQIGNDAMRKALRDRLQGRHMIRNAEIHVDKVGVFEQPVGTARRFIEDNAARIDDQTFLVVDIGYGSTDVARVRVSRGDDGAIRPATDFSMSEWLAVSQACETAAWTLAQAIDAPVTKESLSRALAGDGRIMKAGDSIDVPPYVESSALSVGRRLTAAIRSQLRSLDDIDVVILTGGGARLFRKAIDLGRRTEIMADSSLANAQGFLLLGQDVHG